MSNASPTWGKIKAHAEKQIEHNRSLLESAQPDTLLTLQSRIRVWREVLDLPATLAEEPIDAAPSGYN